MSKLYKTPKKSNGEGGYGTYYVLNKRERLGLKVIKSYYGLSTWQKFLEKDLDGYHDYQEFNRHEALGEAIYEAAAMVMLHLVDFVPAVHDVVWVKKGDRYALGIMMEHIPGVSLAKHIGTNDAWNEQTRAEELLCDKAAWKSEKRMSKAITKHGIDVFDWHAWNILVHEKKQYRIDFGNNFFYVQNTYKDKFNQIVAEIALSVIGSFPE